MAGFSESSNKSVSRSNRQRSSVRVDQVVAHVSKGWMPANPKSLMKVSSLLSSSDSADVRQQVVRQVVEDPGLFLWGVRASPIRGQNQDLLTSLEEMSYADLCSLFNTSSSDLSLLNFKQASAMQRLSWRTTTTAAVAVRKLSDQLNLDTAALCSASHLRAMVNNLLAWNYPSIYSQSLSRCRQGATDFDHELGSILGANTGDIGHKLFTSWSVPKHIVELVEEPKNLEGHVLHGAELYAKSREPKMFPNAQKQWEAKLKQFESIFTEELIASLEQELTTIVEVSPSEHSSPQHSPISFVPAELNNPALKKLSPELTLAFEHVYRVVTPGAASPQALKNLVERLLPKIHFSGGCLFLVGQRGGLIPSLRMGRMALGNPKTHLALPDGVVLANPSSTTLYRFGISLVNGKHLVCFSTGFISTRRAGVLYLESDVPIAERDITELSHRFQAVHYTLLHALGERL